MVMQALPVLLTADQPAYSILNDMEPGSAPVNAALQVAGLAMDSESWQLSDSQLMQAIQDTGVAQPLAQDDPTVQAPVVPRPNATGGAANTAGRAAGS